MSNRLALLGGNKGIGFQLPHEIWPPPAGQLELEELKAQRNKDISIRGKSGPIAEFEEQFKVFLENKSKFAVTFNSGTSALLAAYFALGIEEDDEVIGPALTYHAALSPVYCLKGNVRLADIDLKTRCIDAASIEKLITQKTKLITVVHQWGHPADMDSILNLAQKHNLKVLEDCSHAHGSKYKNKFCGTLGDIGVFSLQTNKMVFAGEGGILITNNEEYHNKATLLGHYRDRSKKEINDPNYQKYWVTGFGLKLRMSPFNAIVAKHSLNNYNKTKEGRHKCLHYLNLKLKEIDFLEPVHVSDEIDMGAWYGFKPLYKKEKLGGLSREKLIEALQAEGMEISNPSAPTLSTQPLYNEKYDLMFPSRRGKISNSPVDTPNALKVENESLSLPTFWDWENDKSIIDSYIETFKKISQNYKDLLI